MISVSTFSSLALVWHFLITFTLSFLPLLPLTTTQSSHYYHHSRYYYLLIFFSGSCLRFRFQNPLCLTTTFPESQPDTINCINRANSSIPVLLLSPNFLFLLYSNFKTFSSIFLNLVGFEFPPFSF